MADRAFLTHVSALKSEINEQITHLKDSDDEELKMLNDAKAHIQMAQNLINKFYDKQGKIFTGKVYYVGHDKDTWMGRLDDKKTGPVVMIKVANLGPAEKLVRRGDGTIMVESYGGSWRNPPFIKLV